MTVSPYELFEKDALSFGQVRDTFSSLLQRVRTGVTRAAPAAAPAARMVTQPAARAARPITQVMRVHPTPPPIPPEALQRRQGTTYQPSPLGQTVQARSPVQTPRSGAQGVYTAGRAEAPTMYQGSPIPKTLATNPQAAAAAAPRATPAAGQANAQTSIGYDRRFAPKRSERDYETIAHRELPNAGLGGVLALSPEGSFLKNDPRFRKLYHSGDVEHLDALAHHLLHHQSQGGQINADSALRILRDPSFRASAKHFKYSMLRKTAAQLFLHNAAQLRR